MRAVAHISPPGQLMGQLEKLSYPSCLALLTGGALFLPTHLAFLRVIGVGISTPFVWLAAWGAVCLPLWQSMILASALGYLSGDLTGQKGALGLTLYLLATLLTALFRPPFNLSEALLFGLRVTVWSLSFQILGQGAIYMGLEGRVALTGCSTWLPSALCLSLRDGAESSFVPLVGGLRKLTRAYFSRKQLRKDSLSHS